MSKNEAIIKFLVSALALTDVERYFCIISMKQVCLPRGAR